ncbi:expressed protein [Echinococcus multilocularis]|uniref:Expressed protein n=1 Tax=Echinococcus multilocularis TaxID=6211 RepID=A0A068XV50_ECHMU|nr:expressed protein [Echinococcus multilocularis]
MEAFLRGDNFVRSQPYVQRIRDGQSQSHGTVHVGGGEWPKGCVLRGTSEVKKSIASIVRFLHRGYSCCLGDCHLVGVTHSASTTATAEMQTSLPTLSLSP